MISPEIYAGLHPPIQRRYMVYGEKSKTVEEIVAHIKSKVANYFEVTTDDLESKNRQAIYVLPRQVAMYFICQKTTLHLVQVAAYFNRDHSTVIYSLKYIRDQLDVSAKFRRKMAEIEDLIKL